MTDEAPSLGAGSNCPTCGHYISKSTPLIGQKYGRWLTLAVAEKSGRTRRWLFRCECGTEAVLSGASVATGASQSCGCLQKERVRKHGWVGTPEYNSWHNAVQRVTNPNDKAWDRYGGRGITMAPEWIADAGAFCDYMGPKPGPEYSVDRIDNDGNYEPGNVRWATPKEQANNKRSRAKVSPPAREERP